MSQNHSTVEAVVKTYFDGLYEGDADKLLKEDRSIASGRAMAEIEAGKGRKPKPFILKGIKEFRKDAVWDSDRGDAAEARASEKASTSKPNTASSKPDAKPIEGKKISSILRFVEPQLCKLLERPPAGAGWAHEVKFDGYRMQLRVEDGKAKLLTRKGLDWTGKFSAIARAAAKFPDCIIDGEVCALDHNGAPDFAAPGFGSPVLGARVIAACGALRDAA